ncbi:MAG: hypothetical protein LBE12_10730 [Planctomycetaceae bacterium]|nr:hypothetical protein [Planctomycetaceae bacterium]
MTRGSAELMVYYDDYQDDIENDTVPSHLSYPLPTYTLEGDEDLIWDFERFVNKNGRRICCREHFLSSWSKARRFSQLFAAENDDINYECLVPKEEFDPALYSPPPGVLVY